MSETKSISFSVYKKELATQISICNQISPKKSEVDLFTFTKVEIKDGYIHFSVLSGNLYYTSKLKLAGAGEELSFLIKTEAFANIVSLMSDEEITFEADLNKLTLVVKGSKSKHQLRISKDSIDDFNIPRTDKDKVKVRFNIESNQLIDANKAAFISVGLPRNIYQPEFLNICYTVLPEAKKLYIVSTDRFRITKNILEVNYLFVAEDISKEPATNYLLPPKTLQILVANAQGESQEIVFEEEFAFFQFENATIISRYGEGKYADYEKIIPTSFGCSFNAKTEEFLIGLKQVLWCVRSDLNRSISVSLNPNEKKLLLSSKSADGEQAEYEIVLEEYEGDQENWSQSFNAEYLIDYMTILKNETFVWESNPGKPAIISPKDKKEKQFYLVSGLK
jgi:DNA polymerase III sliding clamp (beta) subunit (PCNA family)